MNFKQQLDDDLNVFFSTEEFAQTTRIEYDDVFKEIPIIFDIEEEKNRNITIKDHAEGLHIEIVVIRMRLRDIEKSPRKGSRMFLNDELYIVRSMREEYDEVIVELERYDE